MGEQQFRHDYQGEDAKVTKDRSRRRGIKRVAQREPQENLLNRPRGRQGNFPRHECAWERDEAWMYDTVKSGFTLSVCAVVYFVGQGAGK
ncbi:hypothetical protein BD410DRAFT_782206 [Rickenella mellea]|uniref:Uncharacterized protein n=1 Tax=Rickenella mellea TaxID=50990 RepID=A0A4Y7QLI2_9AGAM|nr:hypothetical protein BD410DRAFT_782206 [Rickenella mellea]